MRKDIYERMILLKNENIKPNYAELAKRYDCDYRTIKKYFESDDSKITKIQRSSKLDSFKSIITEKLTIPCSFYAIYKFIQTKGYNGKYTILRDYCHHIKAEEKLKATIRFETNPGLQAQVDWKESMTLTSLSGEVFTINIFLIVLGYSRMKYIKLTLDKNQDTLLMCMKNAFKYFNGVPKEILFDNMKTVVTHSKTQYDKAVINSKFYEFSKDMGFEVITCRPYRPSTKGKVEVVAKLMNRLLVYNNEFDSIDGLDKIIVELNEDINQNVCQSTSEIPFKRFEKEKEYLHKLPNQILLESNTTDVITRKVSKESMITYNKCKYSVNIKYIGKIIELRIESNTLCLYYNNLLIKKHELSNKPYNYDRDDVVEILKSDVFKYKSDEDIEKFTSEFMKSYDNL